MMSQDSAYGDSAAERGEAAWAPVDRRGRDRRFGLEEAVDGEVPREVLERMTRHANGCPECADELDRLRRIKELVRRSCVDTAPLSLRERIAVQYRSISVTRTESGESSVRVTRTEYRAD